MLIRLLLHHRPVDEMVLLTYPVVIGRVTRLFPATGPDIGLETGAGRPAVHPGGVDDPDLPRHGSPQYETATT
jgi:hypothetical protein